MTAPSPTPSRPLRGALHPCAGHARSFRHAVPEACAARTSAPSAVVQGPDDRASVVVESPDHERIRATLIASSARSASARQIDLTSALLAAQLGRAAAQGAIPRQIDLTQRRARVFDGVTRRLDARCSRAARILRDPAVGPCSTLRTCQQTPITVVCVRALRRAQKRLRGPALSLQLVAAKALLSATSSEQSHGTRSSSHARSASGDAWDTPAARGDLRHLGGAAPLRDRAAPRLSTMSASPVGGERPNTQTAQACCEARSSSPQASPFLRLGRGRGASRRTEHRS